jgi:FKBP-type peptidyl-prolyl cis-trans isomerase
MGDPIHRLRSDVPGSLVALIDSLLEPDSARRPRSADAVVMELERIRAETAGRSRRLPAEQKTKEALRTAQDNLERAEKHQKEADAQRYKANEAQREATATRDECSKELKSLETALRSASAEEVKKHQAQLRAAVTQPAPAAIPRAATKAPPCNCAPGDPLCSCL